MWHVVKREWSKFPIPGNVSVLSDGADVDRHCSWTMFVETTLSGLEGRLTFRGVDKSGRRGWSGGRTTMHFLYVLPAVGVTIRDMRTSG